MFYVGQKVVCVISGPIPGDFRTIGLWDTCEAPIENAVYTIRNIIPDPRFPEETVVLQFYELERSPEAIENNCIGYHPRRFRPIVEKKTDISVFTEMLNTKQKELDPV